MSASGKRERRVKRRKQVHKHTGEVKMAKKKRKFDTAGESHSVARDLGNRKKFHLQDLRHIEMLNPRQEEFVQAYFQGFPIIFGTGVPGSAKTFLAMYGALSDVLDPSMPQQKIKIVRSSAQSRDQGFLPGTEAEKMAPFEGAYEGICSELMPRYKDAYKHLKSFGQLEFDSTSFERGKTYHDTVVVFDEFQSATYHEINTIITRLGDNSRIVLLGDSNQCDLTKRGDISGFEKAINQAWRMPRNSYAHIHFEPEDCVRSGVVREWILAGVE